MTTGPPPSPGTGRFSPEYRFFRAVIKAVADDTIELPTLPDVALRAADISRQDDVTADRLAKEIGRDPAIAARVIKVANSASQRGVSLVRTLQQAVTRLGFTKTRMLVSAFAAEQLYRCTSIELTRSLRRSWANSIEVAALARTIARRFTRLDPDEAMLAGLIHEVGILPIIATAAQDAYMRDRHEALEELIFRLHARIGRRLLTKWNFPPALAAVPESCTAFERRHDGPADLSDVVCVALLHERPLRKAWLARVDRNRVNAYAHLDLVASAGVPRAGDFDAEFEETRRLLGG